MIKNLNENQSLLEGKHGVGRETYVDKKKETVNALRMSLSFEAIKEEAKLKYDTLKIQDKTEKPSEDAFINAYVGYKWLNPNNKNYLTIVDFYPNNHQGGLFYIINMQTNEVEYLNKVGHGVGSRGEKDSPSGSPDSYSNEPGSKQSSLGFFKTDKNLRPGSLNIREGLKVKGVEKGINDNAEKRAIYIHPAGLDQSEGCFTLPYDKSDGQTGEDEILKQLMKIKGESIVFAYDSRVFEEYKKQSKLFSNHVEHTGNSGLYIVDKEDEEGIKERITHNKEDDEISFFQRSIDFVGRKFFESRYERQKEKDRECRWKKKQIEKLASQIGKEINKELKDLTEKERDDLEDLYQNINKVWLGFREEFYKSKPKKRREDINKWISKFWEDIDDLINEKGGLEYLKQFCIDKKFEYEKWEMESLQKHRRISGDELAEVRLAA